MSQINFGEDVRIRVREKFIRIYQELAAEKGIGIFPSNGHIFIFCANLGYKYRQKSEPSVLKDPSTFRFSSLTNHLRTFYLAVGMLGGSGINHESLKNADKLKGTVELYADAGMLIFIDKFLRDYLHEDENGNYRLNYSEKDCDLEKDLLVYVWEEMNNLVI